METSVVDVLLNGSPMAAFAVFLIYLYKTQQARMDTLVDKFQSQLEGIRKEYKEDVVELRSRYDAVISNQSQEKKAIKTGIEERLKEVHTTLSNIKGSCQSLSISQEVTRDELAKIAKDVQTGLDIVKEMREESRLKEIARSVGVVNRGSDPQS
jgi:uncharacterized protein YoxC